MPGVVDADAVADQPRQRLAEAGGEAEVADRLGDRVLLLAGADVDAHERLRLLDGRGLGEVDDVDRRAVGAEQLLERLVQRRHDVLEVQRHGRSTEVTTAVDRPVRRVRSSSKRVTSPERRRHEHELRLRQLEQRDLPGPAALRVGVEVELVHDDLADVGVRPAAQARLASTSAVQQMTGRRR
jgi:hypothetical protein